MAKMKIIPAVCFPQLNIPLANFPELYGGFLDSSLTKKTPDIENEGERLMRKKFDNEKEVIDFLNLIFKWGGKTGNRVRGQVYKHNTEQDLHCAIKKSAEHLRRNNIPAAIEKIVSVKGFQISYGSKILRMISPQQCGTYDSVLEKKLPYKSSPEEYVCFCKDLSVIVEALESREIKNPYRDDEGWRAADVEAAIYKYCQLIK